MKNIFGLSIPETLEDVCDPQRVALLVYDMQVGILSQIKNPEQFTVQVLKVLSAARRAGVRILFSRHLSLPKELMGMSQFRMAMAWQRVDSPDQVNPWFLRDAPGRSEEHTSELQSLAYLVCRLLLEKKKSTYNF